MDEEPKDRLRRARMAQRLSSEQLAERIGRAVTTVRAHENGQNGITQVAARLYAEQLKVDPSWLLFGDGVGPQTGEQLEASVSQAALIGEAHRGVWVETRAARQSSGFVPIYAPAYVDFEISCCRVAEDNAAYKENSYLFFVDTDVSRTRVNDDLIISRSRGEGEGLRELSVWRVVWTEEGEKILCLSTRLPDLWGWDEFFEQKGGEVLGIVIGSLWIADIRPVRS